MNHISVGFIGGGRITRVFLGGWTKAHTVPATVVVSDTDQRARPPETALRVCRCGVAGQCDSRGARRCV